MKAGHSSLLTPGPVSLMILITFAALAVRIIYFNGVLGTDDVSVASNALRIAKEGFFLPTSHYGARIGLTIPLSLILGTFGTGEWQMALIPLISSLLGVALAWAIGRRMGGEYVGLLAAGLLALYPLDILNATTLFPDVPLGTTLALAFYLALKAGESEHRLPWLVASGLVWGLAYLIRVDAAFLAPALLSLLLLRDLRLRDLMVIGGLAAGVVLAENLYYWAETGQILYRLKVIQSVSMKVSEEYGGGQRWLYPKAWFITFYQVGLYYYLLAAAAIWAIMRRDRWAIVLLIWVGSLLLWLEFGGNPFSEHYHVKSHLLRYLNIVNVPLTVLVALLIVKMSSNARFQKVLFALILASNLFFINFNTLEYERQQSAKIALSHAEKEGLFPLYADHTSYSIAAFLLRGTPYEKDIHPVQEHDFQSGKTRLVDIDQKKGYLLLSRESMEFDANRYFMKGYNLDELKQHLPVVLVVSNPMNRLAYMQAELLKRAAFLLPSEFLRRKISATAESMLKGDDAIIFRMGETATGRSHHITAERP